MGVSLERQWLGNKWGEAMVCHAEDCEREFGGGLETNRASEMGGPLADHGRLHVGMIFTAT